MIDEYLANGYRIFRNIIPPSLLTDLRRQADIARDLAHQLNGHQTQRIQPLDQYGDRIDLQPFRDYVELPALKDAVEALLGPGYTHGHLHIMGLLVEVAIAGRNQEVRDAVDEVWHDLRIFNQVNCALYADSCTWLVPGSHLRSFDLPGEQQTTDDPTLRTLPEEYSTVDAERFYIEHCQQMPGAQPMHLNAGDFMIYRSHGWHTGLYLPYQPRATIHDIVSHPDREQVTARWRTAQQEARAALEAQ